ncbi:MAG: hypothetical protein KatS3mg002_1331 [Candidatus Woesearchaeota archaeon]|nr:MAG: hypothetical protein KatS3mg002_1331 [Candidatus Woesearchaeota archaeon]
MNIIDLIEIKDYIKSKGLTEEHIFKRILNIENKNLDGYREYSMFNIEDTPSQFIYWNDFFNEYRFKDFSSGKEGDIIDYVAYKYFEGNKTDAKKAIMNICDEIVNNKISIKLDNKNKDSIEYKLKKSKLDKINSLKILGFADKYYNNKKDLYFVEELKIHPKIIKEFGVLTVIDEDRTKFLYVDADGTFCQIYDPFADNKMFKFYNISSFKMDSLPFGFKAKINSMNSIKNIYICSSIKDMLCLNNHFYINYMLYNLAVTYLNERVIDERNIHDIMKKYNLFVIFDGDETGLKISSEIKKISKKIKVIDVRQSFYDEDTMKYKDIAEMQQDRKDLNKLKLDCYV